MHHFRFSTFDDPVEVVDLLDVAESAVREKRGLLSEEPFINIIKCARIGIMTPTMKKWPLLETVLFARSSADSATVVRAFLLFENSTSNSPPESSPRDPQVDQLRNEFTSITPFLIWYSWCTWKAGKSRLTFSGYSSSAVISSTGIECIIKKRKGGYVTFDGGCVAPGVAQPACTIAFNQVLLFQSSRK